MIKVISEIGSNHNGNYELALKMIDKSIECGADMVKFQTFDPDELVTVRAPKAEYQINNLGKSGSQKNMLEDLKLDHEHFRMLFSYARSKGIDIFSTPFDEPSVDFLYSLGQNTWKIPSGEITNLPFLEKIASLEIADKHVILSTGMATLDEIQCALSILRYNSPRITVLHCVTNYPADDDDLNLRAILKFRELFPDCDIGYSDHSQGIIAALVAAGMGITMVEKHFTLDKNLPGPDHKASIDPIELKALCQGIRRAERMLGRQEKIVSEHEACNRLWARKSIVARHAIHAGEVFSKDNIACKRPGYGISPMFWHEIIGMHAEQDFAEDELITYSGIQWQGSNSDEQ